MKIISGILYKDGKKTIGLGSHYFPSFHPDKIPLIDPLLHVDEVNKDLNDIKALGFDIVRFAALGSVRRTETGYEKDFSFSDMLQNEIEKNGLCSFIRINGYSLNLRDEADYKMKDQDGNDIPSRWDYFIRSCLNKKNEREDDEGVTKMVADHFKDDKSVLGYQIYNEPAYPFIGFYDYNPASLEEYKNVYQDDNPVPRDRPTEEIDKKTWFQFRKFSNEKLNQYLVDISQVAKNANPEKEVFTCVMPCSIQQGQAIRGSDFFKISEGMDFLGITLYLRPLGETYYEYSRILDACSSVSSYYQKHAWVIECDAAVCVDPRYYKIMMFTILSSGIKGILPYQYRADIVKDNSPEGNKYGIVYNDRTKTKKYEMVKEINAFIHQFGEDFAGKESHFDDVGILFDSDMNIKEDIQFNKGVVNSWKCKEPSSVNSALLYNLLKKNGYYPQLVDRKHASKCKIVILPSYLYPDEDLNRRIEELEKMGVIVTVYNPMLNAFEKTDGSNPISLKKLMSKIDKPFFTSSFEDVDVKVLEDEKEYDIFVINHCEEDRNIDEVNLSFPRFASLSSLKVIYSDDDVNMKISGNQLSLKNLNSVFVFKLSKEK